MRLQSSHAGGDLSGLVIKEKPQAAERARLRQMTRRFESLGRSTCRRRAQYTSFNRHDGFHFFVPPFQRDFDFDTASLSPAVGGVKNETILILIGGALIRFPLVSERPA